MENVSLSGLFAQFVQLLAAEVAKAMTTRDEAAIDKQIATAIDNYNCSADLEHVVRKRVDAAIKESCDEGDISNHVDSYIDREVTRQIEKSDFADAIRSELENNEDVVDRAVITAIKRLARNL